MSGFKLDRKSYQAITDSLRSGGWNGNSEQLHQMLLKEHEATMLRQLEATWRWGEGAKRMVFGLVACAKKRFGTVEVSDTYVTHKGPTITLSFSKKARLQALQMQVKNGGDVYVVRRFNGDWRSSRTFRPAAQATTGPGPKPLSH